jgi:predicted permease
VSASRDPWQGTRRLFRLALGRRTLEADVDQELRFHLEERIEELVVQGRSRADAEREARTRFGDVGRIGAELRRLDSGALARRERGEAILALARDLRLGLRTLHRHPGFAAAVILTLGLGMGATAAIFTVVQRVVLDPLPYSDPERLVRIMNLVPGVAKGEEWNVSNAQYIHYREYVPELDAIGMFQRTGLNLVTGDGARRVQAALVTPGLLPMLGARAARGRIFTEPDGVPGSPAVVLVSHGFWRSALGGDSAVVGRTLRLDDEVVTVAGVIQPGFELPPEQGEGVPPGTEIWLPFRLSPAGPFFNEHTRRGIARVKEGSTIDAVNARFARLRADLPGRFPRAYAQAFFDRYGFETVAHPLKGYVLGSAGRNLWILFGAVGLVLLIACANVVNLYLARLETRRRETDVRAALGAQRRHLARAEWAEAAVLVAGGASVAALVATGGTHWLVSLSPPGIPRLDALSLDWRGLAFTLLLGAVVSLMLAALAARRHRATIGLAHLADGPRAGTGRERQRVRRALVVSQVALALILVVGSALLLRSYARMRGVDPGIDAKGVLVVEWFPSTQRYDSLTRVWQLQDAVLTRLRGLPGVIAAGGGTAVPLSDDYGCTVQGFDETAVFDRLKEAGLTTCAGQVIATPGYLETLGVPLLAGRAPTDLDNLAPERAAVVVSKSFAERFWPGENPLGKGVAPNGRREPFYRVVGVVGDVPATGVDEPPALAIYYPVVTVPGSGRWFRASRFLVLRTSHGDPMDLLPAVRRSISELDPEIPLANAETLEAMLDRSMGRLSFIMTLIGLAGLCSLGLAAIGLYGLISYIVARRTSEIGVRIALGADPGRVKRFVVGDALRLAAFGLVLGVIGAAGAARVLGSLLYGVAPFDPVSYAAAVLVLAGVAGFAGWIPARRAARTDPAQALRSE